jgi:hypothetical protein
MDDNRGQKGGHLLIVIAVVMPRKGHQGVSGGYKQPLSSSGWGCFQGL